MSLQKNIKNALLTGGGSVSRGKTNAPRQYDDRQKPYFADATVQFIDRQIKYASDFFKAQVQGLDVNDPDKIIDAEMRITNVVRPTAAIVRNFDDYKQVLIRSPKVDYIPLGAKIFAAGSTWLTINPDNISAVSGTAIIRRCKAVWNHLDWYGNVISEPMCVENLRANASDPDSQDSMVIGKGYFNVACQYNKETAQIDDNTRMILGTKAYRVSGYSDFQQEFTGDYSTVRILEFALRAEEKNDSTDDFENHVANGKSFRWEITVSGDTTMTAGMKRRFSASSVRNGDAVESTYEKPISYEWKSSDESVAVVDGLGNVTAVSEGETVITAILSQNPSKSKEIGVTVIAGESEAVSFLTTLPKKIAAYETAEIEAAYFENGERTETPVHYEISGADEQCYSAETDGNKLRITCYNGSVTPLVVTAGVGAVSVSGSIMLEGI